MMVTQRLDTVTELPAKAPLGTKLSLTRMRSILIVTALYTAAAVIAMLLFRYVQRVRGYDDLRDEQVTLLFGALMVIAWAFSMFRILRNTSSR
ncbi:MAG: hypothetical protein KDK70_17300 [Myxococcales bacterium]|nr:hypothetical protein [Myxococcales bacterium]